jgi:hypothetical protein
MKSYHDLKVFCGIVTVDLAVWTAWCFYASWCGDLGGLLGGLSFFGAYVGLSSATVAGSRLAFDKFAKEPW